MSSISANGIVPRSLDLGLGIPMSIRAVRRRFVSPCTNLQYAGEDAYVNIYPDTSTPGAFIDPDSTYLCADLTIYNGNFCVDYANFGQAGAWPALIQDWRLYNQGAILEEILEYGTVCHTLAVLKARYQQEMRMFYSTKLRALPEYHRNFIKPPMVDASGNIMHGLNPAGIGFDAAYHSGQTFRNCMVAGADITDGDATNVGAGNTVCMAFTSSPGLSLLRQWGLNQKAGTFLFSKVGFYGKPAYTNTVYAGTAPASGLNSNQNLITPMDWPDLFVPGAVTDIEDNYIKEFGNVCKPQVMANLCNVKCFPIGCAPALNCYSQSGSTYGSLNLSNSLYSGSIANTVAGTSSQPTPFAKSYRICCRPVSGLIGEGAPKMVGTMLMQPGAFYANMHMAPAAIAFQLSSDPCRRIAGTIRDFVRNTGIRNAQSWQDYIWVASVVNNTQSYFEYGPYNFASSSYAPGYAPYHCIPVMVEGIADKFTAAGTSPYGAGVNTIFSSAAATGRSMICNSTAMNTVKASGTGGTEADGWIKSQATGIDGTNPVPTTAPSAVDQLVATPQYRLVRTPWVFNPLTGGTGTTINAAWETQVFYGTYLRSSVPQSTRIFSLTYDGLSRGTLPIPPAASPDIVNNRGTTYLISNISLVGDQIILPNDAASAITKEAAVGNYNVQTSSYRTYVLQVQNASTQTIICPFRITYAYNALFVFQNQQQRNANTAFYYESNCGLNPFAVLDPYGSNANNTIANIPLNTTESTHPCGREGSGTAIVNYGVGYTLPYQYTPMSTGSSTISLQLRIGNDFYPQQPLTNPTEIMTEVVKAMHGWDDPTYSLSVDCPVTTSTTSNTNYELIYDCKKGSRWSTAFFPIDLCDDQTITCNPDMAPLYSVYANNVSTANSIGNAAATRSSIVNGFNWLPPRGYLVPGVFVPPTSTNVLGFNFRAFAPKEGVSSGMFLGNNVITLLMAGAVGLAAKNQSYRCLGIIHHEVKVRYVPGGQILWIY